RARLGAADLASAFRPRISRRPALATGAAVGLVLLLAVWPNPQDDVLRDRQATRDASKAVAEKIEKVADQTRKENAGTRDPRRDTLADQPRQLARRLHATGDHRRAPRAERGAR